MVINHHLILFMFVKVIGSPTDINPASCDHQIKKFIVKSSLQVEHMLILQLENYFFVNILCFMALKIIELDETKDSFLDV